LFGLSNAKSRRKNVKGEESKNGDTSTEYVPPNVKQQIELWEKELNCIRVRPSIMVKLSNQEGYDRFIHFAMSKNIQILKKNPQKKLFIIESRHEKEAMMF